MQKIIGTVLSLILGFYLVLTPNSTAYSPVLVPVTTFGYSVIETVRDGVATAYYGPLPGQQHYKVNYKNDLIMNGPGIETSSGTVPHPGTISANQVKFPVGTLLRIKQRVACENGKTDLVVLFVGRVEDDGDAMKANPNHIDIFCGWGDYGLDNAIEWGTKDVIIEVVKFKTTTKYVFQTA